MAQQVDVKGFGLVEFPDNIERSVMLDALRRKFSQINQGQAVANSTAEPYNPGLAERAASAISSGLQKTGLISDNYRANRIGENVTMGLEALPVIGDAIGGDELGRAIREGDVIGGGFAALGAIPIAGDAAKAVGRKYPLEDLGKWWGDADYEARGGQLKSMNPREYLSQVKPLDETSEMTQENIQDLIDHVESGRRLDPLIINADGSEDGRHRALMAEKLGITDIPVIDYRKNPQQNPMLQVGGAAKAFQEWFSDSKAADPSGKPKIVYHGTNKDIDEFSLDSFGKTDGGWLGKGFYFAESPQDASNYAAKYNSIGKPDYTGGNVLPVYISAKNPLVWESGTDDAKKYAEIKRKLGSEGFTNWLIENGYDSVKFVGSKVQGFPQDLQWMVIDPEQIKSAIGNKGSYSSSSKKIID